MRGALYKKSSGGLRKAWKKRFFAVANQKLMYWDNESANGNPNGEMSLLGCCLCPGEPGDKDGTFRVVPSSLKGSPHFSLDLRQYLCQPRGLAVSIKTYFTCTFWRTGSEDDYYRESVAAGPSSPVKGNKIKGSKAYTLV